MSIHVTNAIAYPGNTTPTLDLSTGALGLGGANYGTFGQVVTSQGSGSAPIWSTIASGAPSTQVFTSSGTYTPTSGKTNFLVFCVGGGGGSTATIYDAGNSVFIGGVGGGSGGCAWRYYNSSEMGSSASITIGGGGTAGTYGVFFGNYSIFSAGSGGDSIFNPGGFTGLTITGGGGVGATSTAGGSGGSTSNSTVEWIGNHGRNNFGYHPGRGGASLIFGGGKGADGNFTTATANGSAGSSGCVVIFEY